MEEEESYVYMGLSMFAFSPTCVLNELVVMGRSLSPPFLDWLNREAVLTLSKKAEVFWAAADVTASFNDWFSFPRDERFSKI